MASFLDNPVVQKSLKDLKRGQFNTKPLSHRKDSIVKFLDYKVTDKFVDNPIVWQFIDEYMSYSHPKILHLVNFWKPLIPSKSWDSFCEYFNNKKFGPVKPVT